MKTLEIIGDICSLFNSFMLFRYYWLEYKGKLVRVK